MHSSAPEYLTQNLDTDTVPEFWRQYLRKWSFTLFSSENRTRAPFSGTRCEHSLTRLFSALLFASNSYWQLRPQGPLLLGPIFLSLSPRGIGSLCCLHLLRLVRVITLVLVSRHFTSLHFIYFCHFSYIHQLNLQLLI